MTDQNTTQPTAKDQPAATTAATPTTSPIATIELEKGGIIRIQLFEKLAPKTVANFTTKANTGFYDNLTFHRVEDWVVQGGDPLGNGTGGGDQATELSSQPFKIGAVGIARGGNIEISNDSQFFIVKKDSDFLNNQYTNFGQVTEGLSVIEGLKIGDKIRRIRVQ
ncbi:MAG TPA: peptidylprolyl isomerase [Patescibacteria group bacterium]|nr:peptidylprolyl isomerase [Patescibacteria group bacterium]